MLTWRNVGNTPERSDRTVFRDKQGREWKDAYEWIKAVSENAQAKANAATARDRQARSRQAEQVARADRDAIRDLAKDASAPEEKT